MMTFFSRKPKEEVSAVKAPKPWWKDWGESLLIAFVIAMVLRTCVVQAFKIPSSSMEDTLLVGDYLLANKFIYGMKIPFTEQRILPIRDPERGDIIVFITPEDKEKAFWQQRNFIKRIIGEPGDTVEIRHKKVYLNGELFEIDQEVHKDSREHQPFLSPRDNSGPFVVPPGHFFVMGDNRDHSHDSRFFGFVPEGNITGLAFIKHWSWDAVEGWPRWSRVGRPIL